MLTELSKRIDEHSKNFDMDLTEYNKEQLRTEEYKKLKWKTFDCEKNQMWKTQSNE